MSRTIKLAAGGCAESFDLEYVAKVMRETGCKVELPEWAERKETV